MDNVSSVSIPKFKGCRAPSDAVRERFKDLSISDKTAAVYRDTQEVLEKQMAYPPLVIRDFYRYELESVPFGQRQVYLSLPFIVQFLPDDLERPFDFKELARKNIENIGLELIEGNSIQYSKENEVIKFLITYSVEGGFCYINKTGIEDGVYMFVLNKIPGSEGLGVFILKKEKKKMHHSYFFKDQPILSAGMFTFQGARIIVATNRSGHYKPSLNHLLMVKKHLSGLGVEVDKIKWVDVS